MNNVTPMPKRQPPRTPTRVEERSSAARLRREAVQRSEVLRAELNPRGAVDLYHAYMAATLTGDMRILRYSPYVLELLQRLGVDESYIAQYQQEAESAALSGTRELPTSADNERLKMVHKGITYILDKTVANLPAPSHQEIQHITDLEEQSKEEAVVIDIATVHQKARYALERSRREKRMKEFERQQQAQAQAQPEPVPESFI